MSEYIVQAAEWAIDKNGNSLYSGCEKIVRCRDCAKHTCTPKGSCRCDYWITFVEPDGFCSWGERKENA